MKIVRMIVVFIFLFYTGVMSQPPFQANQKYLSFEITTTPYLSGGYFLQDKLALEAGIGLAFMGEDNSNGFGLSLGLDMYSPGEPLTTFWGGNVKYEINPNALDEAFWEGSRLSLGGHWGVNIFVVKSFAVAGIIGLEFQLNSPKDVDNSTNLTTFTSGLKARLFL
jgi:hypothetical protein